MGGFTGPPQNGEARCGLIKIPFFSSTSSISNVWNSDNSWSFNLHDMLDNIMNENSAAEKDLSDFHPVDFYSHDPYFSPLAKSDPNYRFSQNYAVVDELKYLGKFVMRNIKNGKWPESIAISMNLSSDDLLVDNEENARLFELIQGGNVKEKEKEKEKLDINKKRFQINHYDGAFHSLKFEIDIWSDKLVENYGKFMGLTPTKKNSILYRREGSLTGIPRKPSSAKSTKSSRTPQKNNFNFDEREVKTKKLSASSSRKTVI